MLLYGRLRVLDHKYRCFGLVCTPGSTMTRANTEETNKLLLIGKKKLFKGHINCLLKLDLKNVLYYKLIGYVKVLLVTKEAGGGLKAWVL